MTRSTERIRLGLALVVTTVFLVQDVAYGQWGRSRPNPVVPRPVVPGVPRPNRPFVPVPSLPPRPQVVWVTVWTCSRCAAELGRGDVQPALAVCPRCGASFRAGWTISRKSTPTEGAATDTFKPWTNVLLAGSAVAALAAVLVVLVCRRRACEALGVPGLATPLGALETTAGKATAGRTSPDGRTVFLARQICALTPDRLYRVFLENKRFYLIRIGGQGTGGLDAVGIHFGLLGVLLVALLKGKTMSPEEAAAIDAESPEDLLARHKHNFSFTAAEVVESTLDPPSVLAQHGPHVARWSVVFRDGAKRHLQLEKVEDVCSAMEALPAALGPLLRINVRWDEKAQKCCKSP